MVYRGNIAATDTNGVMQIDTFIMRLRAWRAAYLPL